QDPPPICISPVRAADLCLDFHDIHISKNKFNICLDVQAKAFTRTVKHMELGCLP
ncbi:hypothetical protein NPIL_512971, partial [Nephila pilipes]